MSRNNVDLDQTPFLWCLIWVCAVLAGLYLPNAQDKYVLGDCASRVFDYWNRCSEIHVACVFHKDV